ncbi:MAG: TerC family protein [Verrucomicrobiales bacterium]|nr:TerC family protein [Verrucomicrobiales bacterium]
MTESPLFWSIFATVILTMLALDLGVFHRKSHVVTFRESLTWTIVWVTLASAFGAWIWLARGPQAGLEFMTGYLIELSLSADNVFVFALLFGYFAVPPQYQHKVLFWGVLSAIVLRFVMIMVGDALLTRFAWLIYVFGGFLIFTGIKLLLQKSQEHHPERNVVVRLFRRLMPTTDDYHGAAFFFKMGGRISATPLMMVLLCVEVSDVIFALDSIPAIFAITRDSFIVFTSNVFAILGLRSLYFLLAGVMDKFHYLRAGLGLVLAFVGVKMILGHTPWKIPVGPALGVVALILGASIAASLLWPPKDSRSETAA